MQDDAHSKGNTISPPVVWSNEFRAAAAGVVLVVLWNLYSALANGRYLALLTCLVVLVLHCLYAFVWLRTDEFTKIAQKQRPGVEPYETFVNAALALRAVQLTLYFLVFVTAWHGGALASSSLLFLLGVACCAAGQWLNYYVFAKLGKAGVFYGVRFGHNIPWVHSKVFDTVQHPQYVGCLLSYAGVWMLAPTWPLFHVAVMGCFCYIFTGLTEYNHTATNIKSN